MIKKETDVDSPKSILNLGAGKINVFEFPESGIGILYPPGSWVLCLDKMYLTKNSQIIDIMNWHKKIKNATSGLFLKPTKTRHNANIYKFLERYDILFDRIAMYRFLEHVPKTEVMNFIYKLSTNIEIGGYLDIIVPDCKVLAKRILVEDPTDKDFEYEDIITTFELLNEPDCPHASLWSEDRLYHFIEFEKRFKIIYLQKNYEFDGRNLYIRTIAERVK